MTSIELIAGISAIIGTIYVGINRLLTDSHKIISYLTEISNATKDNTTRLDSIDRKLERQDDIQYRTEQRLNDIDRRLMQMENNCFARYEQIQSTQKTTDS